MDQQEQLRVYEQVGKGPAVCWLSPHDGVAHRIRKVSSRSDEPGLVAYFEDGRKSDYVAMYNCELSDFYVLQPLAADAATQTQEQLVT